MDTVSAPEPWAPYRCPRFRRCDTIPMPRAGLFDLLITGLGLAPYKCRACHSKYYRRAMPAVPVSEPEGEVIDWAQFVNNPRPVLVVAADHGPKAPRPVPAASAETQPDQPGEPARSHSLRRRQRPSSQTEPDCVRLSEGSRRDYSPGGQYHPPRRGPATPQGVA